LQLSACSCNSLRLRCAGRVGGGAAAGGKEVPRGHALGDREPPAFDQSERLVDLHALRTSQLLDQVAGRKAVLRAAEAEGAVPDVTLFRTQTHVASPLRERRESALSAGKWRKNTC
jgi:hypothetical protein